MLVMILLKNYHHLFKERYDYKYNNNMILYM